MNPWRVWTRTGGCRFGVMVGVLLILASRPTSAAPIMVESVYTRAGQTVTSTASFDPAGLGGVGTEKVQIEAIDFLFSDTGFVQRPSIVPQVPDGGGNFLQGTFLAIYEDGVFDHLLSESGGGGFAQPPAQVEPSLGPLSPVWVFLVRDGLTRRVGFGGPANYSLDSQTVSIVPEPSTIALWSVAGLCLMAKRQKPR